jgi:hypothetical protein
MFSYELACIETAKNPVQSRRQRRDTNQAQDVAAPRTVYDSESFEQDVLRDIPGDHLIRLLQRAHLFELSRRSADFQQNPLVALNAQA